MLVSRLADTRLSSPCMTIIPMTISECPFNVTISWRSPISHPDKTGNVNERMFRLCGGVCARGFRRVGDFVDMTYVGHVSANILFPGR